MVMQKYLLIIRKNQISTNYLHENRNCANPKVFQPIEWHKKNSNSVALINGGNRSEMYPLVIKIMQDINGDNELQIVDTFSTSQGVDQFAKSLAYTKICIVDTLLVKKAVPEIIEAMMSGCIVAGKFF